MSKNFWFDFRMEVPDETKYRSVVDTYYDFESTDKKACVKETKFLEYQYTVHTLLRLFGFNVINSTKYRWAHVKKPNWHLVITNTIDIRGEVAKSTESFWHDVSVKKDPSLTTNRTMLVVNEEADGDLNDFIKKWPSYKKYEEEYYWPEVRRVYNENKDKVKEVKKEEPKIVNLN